MIENSTRGFYLCPSLNVLLPEHPSAAISSLKALTIESAVFEVDDESGDKGGLLTLDGIVTPLFLKRFS